MTAATTLFLQDTSQIVVESRIGRCEHPDEIAEADTTVEVGTKCAVCGEEID